MTSECKFSTGLDKLMQEAVQELGDALFSCGVTQDKNQLSFSDNSLLGFLAKPVHNKNETIPETEYSIFA